MRLQDLHTHSHFDDGCAPLEEMVRTAIGKGFSAIGLSGHSPIEGAAWTIPASRLPAYCAEARRLKEAYQGQIDVYCGIEYDLRSDIDLSQFDYVIGSNHAIITQRGSFDVDDTAQVAKEGIDAYFTGDSIAAAQCYFSQYQKLAANPAVDLVGHFDLLTKFDERVQLYQSNHPRYLQAAKEAMEVLTRAGKIFEVNSGAISRGYRSSPYPAKALLSLLRALGGKICLTSDAHSPDGIGCAFRQSLSIVAACGFQVLWFLTRDGFQPIPIELLP